MKKEFIPYTEAIALKELGFNGKCFGYYNIDPSLKEPIFNLIKPFEHEWCLPAPLYQTAFRWFRDKHNIHSMICPKTIPSNEVKYYLFNGKIETNWEALFDTYEEAQLESLRKLIHILRNK